MQICIKRRNTKDDSKIKWYSYPFLVFQESKGARVVTLPGFDVSVASASPGEKSEVKHAFRLSHTQQTLLLSAQDEELQAKWVDVLSKAARGQTPTDASSMSLAEHRKSQ